MPGAQPAFPGRRGEKDIARIVKTIAHGRQILRSVSLGFRSILPKSAGLVARTRV
jgi:hypothetical protein